MDAEKIDPIWKAARSTAEWDYGEITPQFLEEYGFRHFPTVDQGRGPVAPLYAGGIHYGLNGMWVVQAPSGVWIMSLSNKDWTKGLPKLISVRFGIRKADVLLMCRMLRILPIKMTNE